VCRTLFYVREIRHSAHARLDHSRPAAMPHSLRRPGDESLCLSAKRPTQAEPGLALEAGQARSAPTRAHLREGGQDRGFGLGIRQPASTRAASCRESGSRRKLSPDRRAQKRHGSLVGRLERSMILIGLVDGGSSTDAVVTNRAGERNRVAVSGTGPVSPAPRAAHAHRHRRRARVGTCGMKRSTVATAIAKSPQDQTRGHGVSTFMMPSR
jgi:hypothetical protein